VRAELGIIAGKLGVIVEVGAFYEEGAALPQNALDTASKNADVLPATAAAIVGVRHELTDLSLSIDAMRNARKNAGSWVSRQGGQPMPPPWTPYARTVADHVTRTRSAITRLEAALTLDAKR
jgi:hypothetical protein